MVDGMSDIKLIMMFIYCHKENVIAHDEKFYQFDNPFLIFITPCRQCEIC